LLGVRTAVRGFLGNLLGQFQRNGKVRRQLNMDFQTKSLTAGERLPQIITSRAGFQLINDVNVLSKYKCEMPDDLCTSQHVYRMYLTGLWRHAEVQVQTS